MQTRIRWGVRAQYMGQGNDVGSQYAGAGGFAFAYWRARTRVEWRMGRRYRSAIVVYSEEQMRLALASRDRYQVCVPFQGNVM